MVLSEARGPVIMIEVVVEEMHGSDRVSEPEVGYERALGWLRTIIYESEMALFPECTESCAQKVSDTADIVRDAIFHQSIKSLESRLRDAMMSALRSLSFTLDPKAV